MIKLAFDVMGSDKGPDIAVKAAMKFLETKDDLFISFYGNEDAINKAIKESNSKIDNSRYEVVPTTEVIEMTGSVMDIRRKKDSSLVKAIEAVKENKVDGMLTGGSSAAFIAGSQMILGTIDGVERSGFMPTIPTIVDGKVTLLIDAGANLDNTPEQIDTFAKMATVYSKAVNNVESPKIGLLNIGEEPTKGKELQRDSYKLLQEDKNINFFGNIESRYMTSGLVDVIVTDGYDGNIALKAIEGMAKNLLNEVKKGLLKNFWTKLMAVGSLKTFKALGTKFDYKNHAGAILLGVDGIVFKSHGSSDEKSFTATLRMTYDAVKNNVLNKLKKGMSNI